MPGKYLIIHHTGGSNANPLADSSNYTVLQCDKDHKNRFDFKSSLGWYVGYHYYIDKAGVVTQCRKDTEMGAHTVGYNDSIGICLAGNFDATDPTEAQKTALRELLKTKMAQYAIPLSNLYPHRKFATKTCYGRRLADNWLQTLMETKTIRVKLVVGHTHDHALLEQRENIVREYYSRISGGTINLEFSTIHNARIDFSTIEWNKPNFKDMNTIKMDWLAMNIVPYASGCDAVVFWLPKEQWKSEGSIAYSLPDQILGVHTIAMGNGENTADPYRKGRYDGKWFTGTLAHELAHMFYQRVGGSDPINWTDQHKPGYDNSHYYDFVKNTLDPIPQEVDILKFIGWKPEKGVRMFKYGPVSYKRQKFSGVPVEGKVYVSTGRRMFFRYQNGWHSITESQYTSSVLTGSLHGTMSDQEANEIQYTLGIPIPPKKPKVILQKIVTSKTEEIALSLIGWSYDIPQLHLI